MLPLKFQAFSSSHRGSPLAFSGSFSLFQLLHWRVEEGLLQQTWAAPGWAVTPGPSIPNLHNPAAAGLGSELQGQLALSFDNLTRAIQCMLQFQRCNLWYGGAVGSSTSVSTGTSQTHPIPIFLSVFSSFGKRRRWATCDALIQLPA